MMKQFTIAVDFDGTCVHDAFPHVGADMFGAELALKRLVEDGHRIILWTCREHTAYLTVPDTLQLAIDWFTKKGITLYAINGNPDMTMQGFPLCRKCHCDILIDDKSLFIPRCNNGDLDWHTIYTEIKRLSIKQ